MIVPPGFVAIFARFTNLTGHQCQNVVGYSVDAPLDQTDADDISFALGTQYKTQLSTSSTWLGVHIIVGNDGADGVLDSSEGAGAGGRGVAMLSPQVQGLIRKSTTLAGRKHRGRLFLPDMAESQVDDSGGINSTGTGTLDNISNQWMSLSTTVANLGGPVLLHNDSTAPTVITAMAAETKVATLRRRYDR